MTEKNYNYDAFSEFEKTILYKDIVKYFECRLEEIRSYLEEFSEDSLSSHNYDRGRIFAIKKILSFFKNIKSFQLDDIDNSDKSTEYNIEI